MGSSLTPTAVGAPMEVVHSLVKTQPRLTGLRHMFADRWQNRSSKAVCANEPLSNCPMQLVLRSLCPFVETYGTEQNALSAEDITNIIKIEFDCRPGAIAT